MSSIDNENQNLVHDLQWFNDIQSFNDLADTSDKDTIEHINSFVGHYNKDKKIEGVVFGSFDDNVKKLTSDLANLKFPKALCGFIKQVNDDNTKNGPPIILVSKRVVQEGKMEEMIQK